MHKNNFDFLRLIFALFVIISHSYALTGSHADDWVTQVCHRQMSFAYIGVAGFFAISGYLIVQSLQNSNSLSEYFRKRVLRIYPALAGVLILTVLLGAFVYNGTLAGYLKNSSTWTYIPRNLTLFWYQYGIKGVFENNPFRSAINGSLCTIPYEVLFYILISFLLFIKSNRQRIFFIATIFALAMLIKIFLYGVLLKNGYPYFIRRGIDVSGDFLVGTLLALGRAGRVKHKYILCLLMVVIWIISLALNVFQSFQYLVLPVAVIMFGESSTPVINSIRQTIGDLSYGIYIYAFPVQQTLVHFCTLTPMQLMIVTPLITIPFAYLSWHLIEKKALTLKVNTTRVK